MSRIDQQSTDREESNSNNQPTIVAIERPLLERVYELAKGRVDDGLARPIHPEELPYDIEAALDTLETVSSALEANKPSLLDDPTEETQ